MAQEIKEIVLEGDQVSLRELMKILSRYQEIRIHNIGDKKAKILKIALKERNLLYQERVVNDKIIRINTDKSTIFIFKR